MNGKDRMFWTLAVVRGLWGFFGTLFSLYARYFQPELSNVPNIATSRTELSYALMSAFLGFFVFEWLAQIFFDIRFGALSKALHAHHIIAFVGYWNTVMLERAHFIGCSAFIDEMTTPFSCESCLKRVKVFAKNFKIFMYIKASATV